MSELQQITPVESGEIEKADSQGSILAKKHGLSQEDGDKIALLITEQGANATYVDELLENYTIDEISGAYEIVRTSESMDGKYPEEEPFPPTVESVAKALRVFEDSEDEIYVRLRNVTIGLGVKYSSVILEKITDFAEKESIPTFEEACDRLYGEHIAS